MAETDASLKFDEPLEGPATAPLSEEALSRSTASSPATAVTNYVEVSSEAASGFQPGVLIGPYKLVSKLGEGGMGIVFKATHTKLDKTVAIKLLPSAYLTQKSVLERFEREMRAVGGIVHPNVVQAFDAGEQQGTHFLVMEYVEGTDLQRLVMMRGVMTVANACKAIYQAALGLQAAHQVGRVHRDIKPSNLFVTKAGQIKILDLGLASLQDDGEGGALTRSGQVFGTPEYMAPEQWEDVHACDGRTDLYALGCTLFFLLTARPPYGGEDYKTAPRKMLGHINDPIPDLRNLRTDVPPELDEIYHRLMSKKAADRYAFASELAEALEPWIAVDPALTNLPSTGTNRSKVAPAGATVPDQTGVKGSSRPKDSEVTLALDPVQAESPTVLSGLDHGGHTAVAPPDVPPPNRKWLWAALGGLAVVVLVAGGIVMSLPKPKPPEVVDNPPPVVPDPVQVTPDETTNDMPEDDPQPQLNPQVVEEFVPPVDAWEIAQHWERLRPPVEPVDPLAQIPLEPLFEPEPPEPVEPVDLLADVPLDPMFAEEPPDPLTLVPISPLFEPEPVVEDPSEQVAILPEFAPEPPPYVPASLKAPFDGRAAQQARAAWAAHLKIAEAVENSIGMELVLIPPGEFDMGPNSQPQPVKLTKPFYVGKYEVLQSEYEKVAGGNPSRFSPKGPPVFKKMVAGLNTARFPVDSVSWDEALAFCNQLSQKENLEPYYTPGGKVLGGSGYRLLTEAEWEYMCRAGTDTQYALGQKLTAALANVKDGSALKRTEQAGRFAENQFGLCDVHGNVFEWCFDFYDEAYVKRATTDPPGPKSGTARVRRGGSWSLDPKYSMSSVRAYLKPGEKPNDAGFRVARTP